MMITVCIDVVLAIFGGSVYTSIEGAAIGIVLYLKISINKLGLSSGVCRAAREIFLLSEQKSTREGDTLRIVILSRYPVV